MSNPMREGSEAFTALCDEIIETAQSIKNAIDGPHPTILSFLHDTLLLSSLAGSLALIAHTAMDQMVEQAQTAFELASNDLIKDLNKYLKEQDKHD